VWWPLWHLDGMWSPSRLSKTCFAAALRATMWRVLAEEVQLGYSVIFFLSPLFSFSSPKTSRLNFKKTIMSSDLWFDWFWSFFFYHCLFSFWCFLKFFLNFISWHFIQFDFLIQFGPFTFDFSISVFYTFLDYYLFASSSLLILLHFF